MSIPLNGAVCHSRDSHMHVIKPLVKVSDSFSVEEVL